MKNKRIKEFVNQFYKDNFTPPYYTANNQTNNHRIEFIDLAKGLCIFLVFYGHSNMAEFFDIPLIQSLRMPLYFFLSGLFFKYYDSLANLIEKKLNKLIVPFVFFSILAIPLIIIQHHGLPVNQLLAPLISPRGGYNIVVWFLLCLFWCNMIFGILYHCFNSLNIQFLCVLGIGTIGCVLGSVKITLPLHITQAMIALPFFFAGYVTKRTPLLYKNEKLDKWLWIVGLALVGLSWMVYYLFGNPAIYFLDLEFKGNIILAYIISLSIVLGVLFLCKAIGWLPILSYMGRYSVIILGLHWLAIKTYSIVYSVLISKDFNIPLRFVICLFCCWIAIPIFRKLFPAFTAQKDLIKWPKRLPQTAV